MTDMNFSKRWALAGALASVATAAVADNGDVDTSFGSGGVARTGSSDMYGASNGCKPLVQPDGKILICGARLMNGSSGSDFLVARFTANGVLDTSFSFDGLTTIDFDNGAGSDLANGIALQPDGKIVVIGTTWGANTGNTDFAVARLNADGTLDTTFGAGTGKTTIEFDLDAGTGQDYANAVTIQPDGRIVVAGSAQTATGAVTALTRLLGDGTRDSAFNLNGKVTFSFNVAGATGENDAASGVAIDDAGRIVIGATVAYSNPQTQSDFGAARLLANGQPDSNFHANGHTTIGFDPGSGISTAQTGGLALQRDGRIVIVGYANSSASMTDNADMAVARLLPDGSADATFGLAGKTLVAFDLVASGLDFAFGVAEQTDGRLVIVGTSIGASSVQLATAARLTRNGVLDASFGAFGKKTYDFALTNPDGQAFTGLAFQGNQIIAGGVAYVPPGGNTDFIDALAVRLTDDTIFADGFE